MSKIDYTIWEKVRLIEEEKNCAIKSLKEINNDLSKGKHTA